MRRVPREDDDRSSREAAETCAEGSYRSGLLPWLFAATPDAVVVFDGATGAVVDANEAALRLYGYSRHEILGLRQGDLTAEPEASLRSSGGAGEGPWSLRRRHRKKDGTVFAVEIVPFSPRVVQGRTWLASRVRDLDALEAEGQATALAERGAGESSRYGADDRTGFAPSPRGGSSLGALLTAGPDSFVLADAEGRFLEVSEAFCQLVGYSRSELLGMRMSDLVVSESEQRVAATVERIADCLVSPDAEGARA